MKKRNKKRIISSVIAALTPELPIGALKAYQCASCNTEVATNVAKPFCTECGSETLEEVDDTSLTEIEDITDIEDEELSSIKCPKCEACNILSDVTAKELDGMLNCVACGSSFQFAASELEDDAEMSMDDEDDEDEDEDNGLGGDEIGEDEDLDDDEDSEASRTEDEDDDSEEDDEEDDSEMSMDEEDDSDEETDDETDDEAELDDEESGADESEDDAEDDSEDDAEDDSDEETDDEVEEEVTMSLLDVANASTTDSSKTRFIRAGSNSILCFVGDISVARLHKSMAGDNEDIFGNDKFTKAISTSFVNNGLENTLKDFGFVIATVQIDKSKVMANAADKAAKEAIAKVQDEMSNQREVLSQCLGLAASGINKGFFKKYSNPLKANLFETLSDVGIKHPQTVIDSAFKKSSDEYNKTLLAAAFELMSRSEDVRNQLAEAIGETQYQTAPVDDLDDDLEIESRLDEGVIESSLDDEDDKPLEKSNIRQLKQTAGVKLF